MRTPRHICTPNTTQQARHEHPKALPTNNLRPQGPCWMNLARVLLPILWADLGSESESPNMWKTHSVQASTAHGMHGRLGHNYGSDRQKLER